MYQLEQILLSAALAALLQIHNNEKKRLQAVVASKYLSLSLI